MKGGGTRNEQSYAKNGFFSLRGLDKALTVTLPEDIALEDVAIDVTSGDVRVPDLNAESATFRMTSGDLDLTQPAAARSVDIDCTSGDIRASLGDVDALAIGGTSGNIEVSLGKAGDVAVSTTSGSIALTGDGAEKAKLGNTSGGISVSLRAFEELKVDSTSGNVTAALPSEPGYRADIDTASGRFDCAVALSRDGDAYVCGDGSGKVEIDTTSGNIRLEEAD